MSSSTPGQQIAFCTIAAKNYVAAVRTLSRSLAVHHPDAACFALIIDDTAGFLDSTREPFQLLGLSDLDLDGWPDLAFKYDIVEFSTAVKPFLLESLLRRGFQKAIYLDPDILVTGRLDRTLEQLDHADFVITPHATDPYPDDSRLPHDQTSALHGIYNLGFFALRNSDNAHRFLTWWQGKLRTQCYKRFQEGLFVDQRFIDLALGYFDGFFIERDPGYNVAYWNLHGRTLSQRGDHWYANDRPLVFFHFSSFNPAEPAVLSKYCYRESVTSRIDFLPLLQVYATQLLQNGHATTRKSPYSWGTFRDGDPIEPALRVRYQRATAAGAVVTDPFRSRAHLLAQVQSYEPRDSFAATLAFRFRSLVPPALWRLGKSFRRNSG